QRPRRREQLRGLPADLAPNLLEQLVLEPPPPLVSTEHLGLVLPELRRHVALRARERLPADVLGGHTRGVGVGDLDAVTEHAIEADAERRDPGTDTLALLEPGDPVARRARVPHDGSKRLVPGLADDPAVVQRERWLVYQGGREARAQRLEVGEVRRRRGEQRRLEPPASLPELAERCQTR